ncbi:hypothetical protein [Paraliomyxa miuraensis]|uniref:hypothetical protein n=1 Tax=Paraliomyxa miuraensis TaxID=376150 RepID=UPI00225788FA|nr:hypothetical protein [Paraliomyxa miuraensis]MCX4244584.1 hypothetical protein [Paraliomyxa miuraensis]
MIDYEVLCQTIEDWRAGRRPSIDLSSTPAAGQGYEAEAGGYEQGQYEEAQYEDAQYEQGYEQGQYEQGYEQGQYEQGYEQGQYEQGYDQYGAPEQVAGSGTSPVDLEEVDPPPYAEGEEEPESVSLDDDY